MKKYSIVLLAIGFLMMAGVSKTKAQFSISLNIGSQPTWGPVGYDHADYYYMPDIESYYNVSNHQFIYMSNGRWVFSASLPPRYANYDLYSGYKVVVNRPRPYLNFQQDRVQYGRYRGYRGHQTIIRDSHDDRYRGNHDGNHEFRGGDNHGNQGRGNGNHGDQGRGNDHHDNGRGNGGDNHGGGDHGNGGGYHGHGDH
ncbi:hypothetical protein [uncultured Mucilaginibacter sp.]|uniref:hypothetical protein n=1 Tax=uncultured Mucilaginibacter sp. TaxID=797541 RepID=UPI0025D61E5E|nr:hypothetical protein [uncultured Mucilaginibacter sp.]